MQSIDRVGRVREAPPERNGVEGLAVSRDLTARDVDRGIDALLCRNRGSERCDKSRAIDTLAAMGQGSVAFGEIGGKCRTAGTNPAVHIGTYLRANPLVVFVV